jgi:hypothetical protein
MMKVSTDHPLRHYQWGDGCDGWNFVEEQTLSVKTGKDAARNFGNIALPQARATILFYTERRCAF